jgi:hypothetical protein
MRFRASVALAALGLAAAVWGAGCSVGPGSGRLGRIFRPQPTAAAPVADSPANAVRLVEWCWSHLDSDAYRLAFSDDYVFVFGSLDPDGNAYRDTPWTRHDELISFDHLVHGGGENQPAAQSVTAILDHNFVATSDARYPASSRWRKLIRTAYTVRVVGREPMMGNGFANFFLVRGDSASIPEEMRQQGFGPDSARWYVTRWEDAGFGEGLRSAPASSVSWGTIKARYR